MTRQGGDPWACPLPPALLLGALALRDDREELAQDDPLRAILADPAKRCPRFEAGGVVATGLSKLDAFWPPVPPRLVRWYLKPPKVVGDYRGKEDALRRSLRADFTSLGFGIALSVIPRAS